VRVATFNLLSGRSLVDGVARDADLAGAAGELDADVVGLQEVDHGQDRSGSADQTAVVAEALGAGWSRFVPAIDATAGAEWTASTTDDGSQPPGPAYGIGLVSRLPVLSWRVRRFGPAPFGLPLLMPSSRRLSHVPDEPRAALAAIIDGPDGPMTVLNTHLSFVPGWNVRQLRALVRWARSMPAPRVLLGDLNLPGGVPRLVTGWTQLARVPTYPSWEPRVQLDHVLSDVPLRASGARAVQLAVSDHRALVVDVELPTDHETG
jgi:endonuclease/exonuclease/phosphatase family metal-dependent hydrolase